MSQFFRAQKQIYDTHPTLAARNPLLFQHVVRRIQQLLKRYQGSGPLLDLGGYDGTISSGFNTVVLDISQLGLSLARDRGLFACIGDFHQIPFANDSFRTVLVCHALEHSSEPLVVLKELSRVLKPEGHAIIIVPNAAALRQIGHLLRGEVKPSGNRPSDPPNHYGQYTLQNTKALVAQMEDLQITKICGDNLWFPFMSRLHLYAITTRLGTLFPRFSDSLVIVVKKRKDISYLNFVFHAEEIANSRIWRPNTIGE